MARRFAPARLLQVCKLEVHQPTHPHLHDTYIAPVRMHAAILSAELEQLKKSK